MAGKNITTLNDPLVKVTSEYLFHAVSKPKPAIESAIRQLRIVRNIDSKRYQMLKRNLPYIVTSVFHPAIRRTENFAWANHLMLDVDHLSEKEISVEQMKTKLSSDNRILLMFTSPGEDGLKILFRIKEKLYDPAQFSLFYKAFATDFSAKYHLEQVIDKKTSDATRACFISFDKVPYYNADAEPLNHEKYINLENFLEVKQIKKDLEQSENIRPTGETIPLDLEEEVLAKIKSTLNPSYKLKKKKQIYVPEEVESIAESIINHLNGHGVQTKEMVSINYGKKFRFVLGRKQAEINLFYGKKGYTVVISPRNGTDKELNEVCSQLMIQLLD